MTVIMMIDIIVTIFRMMIIIMKKYTDNHTDYNDDYVKGDSYVNDIN